MGCVKIKQNYYCGFKNIMFTPDLNLITFKIDQLYIYIYFKVHESKKLKK